MPRARWSRWLLVAFVLATVGVVGFTKTIDAQKRGTDKKAKQVRLVIDYGDGVEKHFTRIPWREGMSVLDAMKLAANHARGFKMEYRGRRATAFLTKIDNLENDGRQKNWIYRVNNKLGDRSFAIYKLKPGDTALWKFGKYQ